MDDYIETSDSNETPEDSFGMVLAKSVVLTAASTAAMMTAMLAVPVAYGAIQKKLEERKVAKKLKTIMNPETK